jgi:hypothetical protein
MSYARFRDGCDVYVYLSNEAGTLRCVGCAVDLRSTEEMVSHLRAHIAQGDAVPESVIPALEADRETNDPWLAGISQR